MTRIRVVIWHPDTPERKIRKQANKPCKICSIDYAQTTVAIIERNMGLKHGELSWDLERFSARTMQYEIWYTSKMAPVLVGSLHGHG